VSMKDLINQAKEAKLLANTDRHFPPDFRMHVPSKSEMKARVVHWTETKDLDDAYINNFANWYADVYEGRPWLIIPRLAAAMERYDRHLEIQQSASNHPSRSPQPGLSLFRGLD